MQVRHFIFWSFNVETSVLQVYEDDKDVIFFLGMRLRDYCTHFAEFGKINF
jgi:hypothetical protein